MLFSFVLKLRFGHMRFGLVWSLVCCRWVNLVWSSCVWSLKFGFRRLINSKHNLLFAYFLILILRKFCHCHTTDWEIFLIYIWFIAWVGEQWPARVVARAADGVRGAGGGAGRHDPLRRHVQPHPGCLTGGRLSRPLKYRARHRILGRSASRGSAR